MSGGRVTIPNNVRKTIQNIKEITGNHSEDEIYAMLKECSMDPNETAQKLLLQDPFHEVKRKRNRKKETLIKESTEPRWKPGMQGRGNRGVRGTYSSRHMSNVTWTMYDDFFPDTGGGRKENGIIKKSTEEGANQSISQGQKTYVESDKKQSEVTSSSKLEPKVSSSSIDASKIPGVASESGHVAIMKNTSASPSPSPGVYLSEKDPILMPSQDSRLPVAVGTIRREVGSQRTPVDQVQDTPLEIKSTATGSEVGGKAPSEGKNVSFSIPRPSSNYNNRIQQAIGPQKVGPSMEWKPKPTNPVLAESNKGPTIPVESQTPPTSAPTNLVSNPNPDLEKKLKDSHISNDQQQHVIIPNHLHVPEAEKLGFCFGSFDATFGLNKTTSNGPVTVPDKTTSEVSDDVDETALPTTNVDNQENVPESSNNVPENLSPEGGGGDMSSNAVGPTESKHDVPPLGHQHAVVHTHTSPNFSFGFIPPMIGTGTGTHFESNESQARERDGSSTHVPSFVVQQPFDPASYYAQLYRANGNDSDGRMSPFHSTTTNTKYNNNGNTQPSHSSQEVGNSLILPTPTPTAAIAVTQQPLPVFRQPPPPGVHLPHYPPNYIPYGPYFSPFYVPPPPIHQFLTNGTFPQQGGGAGGMYPPPPVAASKYPLPQYKPATNTSGGHIGYPAGNSTSNEDMSGSHFKESNVYITGQQSEGAGVWIAGPGRDMSGSFYNLPQGGQVAYATTPTQGNHGHGSFANIYHHPGQPVTTGGVDMVGPPAGGGSVYQQQPQPNQINWPNNY
ncbi:hypothetical protein LXL04_037957 [Taraxacum kok-saghyz]